MPERDTYIMKRGTVGVMCAHYETHIGPRGAGTIRGFSIEGGWELPEMIEVTVRPMDGVSAKVDGGGQL